MRLLCNSSTAHDRELRFYFCFVFSASTLPHFFFLLFLLWLIQFSFHVSVFLLSFPFSVQLSTCIFRRVLIFFLFVILVLHFSIIVFFFSELKKLSKRKTAVVGLELLSYRAVYDINLKKVHYPLHVPSRCRQEFLRTLVGESNLDFPTSTNTFLIFISVLHFSYDG